MKCILRVRAYICYSDLLNIPAGIAKNRLAMKIFMRKNSIYKAVLEFGLQMANLF